MRELEYLNEVVLYGGVPVLRGDLEQALDAAGVKGPARLTWGRAEAVDREPLQHWNGATWEWITERDEK